MFILFYLSKIFILRKSPFCGKDIYKDISVHLWNNQAYPLDLENVTNFSFVLLFHKFSSFSILFWSFDAWITLKQLTEETFNIGVQSCIKECLLRKPKCQFINYNTQHFRCEVCPDVNIIFANLGNVSKVRSVCYLYVSHIFMYMMFGFFINYTIKFCLELLLHVFPLSWVI